MQFGVRGSLGAGDLARGVPAVVTYSSAQQARQVLADRLRELRVDAGLTGREHARRCEWSVAKTSRIENNKTAPSASDIQTWCHAGGADDQADDLITSLRAVEGMYVEWRRIVRDGLRHASKASLPLFERTHHFRAYSSWVLPGIIQTPAYTGQILRGIQQRRNTVDDIAETLAVRAQRQQLLTTGKRVFGFLIEEFALRTAIVDAATMAEQLDTLTEYAALPNISLGIIPSRLNRSHRPVESFWIFDNAQVNVELVAGYIKVTQQREVAEYGRTFTEFASIAVTGAEARELITAALDTLG